MDQAAQGLRATFVVPWYGPAIPGGAEAAARHLARHLAQAGVRVQVLATTAAGLGTIWGQQNLPAGETLEDGVLVRRFAIAPRDVGAYNAVIARIQANQPLSAQHEHDFFANMIHSAELLDYLGAHPEEGPFFFIPYLFTTSVWGPLLHPSRSVLIPCLHDEPYARFRSVRRAMEACRAVAFNSRSEMELAGRLYDLERTDPRVMGLGLDIDWSGEAERFQQKHGIGGPFVLYVGRKDAGKNTPLLVQHFLRYINEGNGPQGLKLVLAGNLPAPIPPGAERDVLDLGFLETQDKYDAYAAAMVVVQPSLMESFSFVIMEAWLAGAPVMVHSGCPVTREHVLASRGGLHFSDYPHFAEDLNLLLGDAALRGRLAAAGRRYVLDNFAWPVITAGYLKLIEELAAEPAPRPRLARPAPAPAPAAPLSSLEPMPHAQGLRASFVMPWYGPEVPGGAETEARYTALNLAAAGVQVQILTTCLGGLTADWDSQQYPPGESREDGLRVLRFPTARRDGQRYNSLHAMVQAGEPLSLSEEHEFFANMVHSPALLQHIAAHPEEGPFFFIPYPVTTSVWGPLVHPSRSVIIPCLHDEAYARLQAVRRAFEASRALAMHVPAERDLAASLCDLGPGQAMLVGEGMDTGWSADPERFREQFGIEGPFILYAGRKAAEKNTPLLISYFLRYLSERDGAGGLKLVLIGNLPADIPPEGDQSIKDLGFLVDQQKYDAYAAARVFVQPSVMESFSRVIMESWLAGAPVMVHSHCPVTREHVELSGGGLHFADYPHFAECLDLLLARPELCRQMAQAGRRYVLQNFSWPRVTGNYLELIQQISAEPLPAPRPRITPGETAARRLDGQGPAVHQVVPDFAFGDAIGGEALALQKLLRSWGFRSEIYADMIHRRLSGHARLVREIPSQVRPGDVLLGHFSIGHEFWESFLQMPGRKVMRYHNVTPAHFVEPVSPEVAQRCRRGREQLARLAPHMELGLAVSAYNQAELDQAGCPATAEVPILLDLSRLQLPPNPLDLLRYQQADPLILHVGRVAPNKRLEDLIKTHYWLAKLVPRCRLVLVGNQLGMEPYVQALRELMLRLRVARVRLLGHVSTSTLNALYRSADLYLCLSEHEGFCVPLVEAMHFGLPILARAAAGVPGTLGQGGVLLPDGDPLRAAETAARVLGDPQLRRSLAAAGRQRLESFLPQVVARRLRSVLQERLGLEMAA